MVERKLFKTKLCVLYQKGRCARQPCSFAHGDAELRRSFGSYNGGRNYRYSDLRDKIDHRLSPQRRHSPGRDARGRHAFRGHSPSRSLEKISDRKRRKKQHLSEQNDLSGSLKISDGTEDSIKEGNITSDSITIMQEQLKEVQSDNNVLDHHKLQLEIYVGEKEQEADVLTSRIKELETQLHKEKEECKRIDLKIKKFVKAHNRYLRMQDELKRSQARLQKLGNQLASDATGAGGHEEDLSINIVSDVETTNYHLIKPQNERRALSSPNMGKLDSDRGAAVGSIREANLPRDVVRRPESIQLEMLSRWNMNPGQSDIDKVEAPNNGNSSHGPLADKGKLKRGKNVSTSFSSPDKIKGSGSGFVLSSTSMAAHANDEEVEIEVEKIEDVEMASAGIEKGAIYEASGTTFRLPPPPPLPKDTLPLPKNINLQYEGDDENIDVDGL